MPYDHAATFEFTGVPGAAHQDVITIAPDGPFVAVGIGYGFDEDRRRPVRVTAGASAPNALTLGQFPLQALIDGVRLNPRRAPLALDVDDPFGDGDGDVLGAAVLRDDVMSAEVLSDLFERIEAPRPLAFMLSMVDSSSGRELQDEPTLSLASLGAADGRRPFRRFGQPMIFMPRTSLRLHVVERSTARGMLCIVLYGYRLMAGSACTEPHVRALLAATEAELSAVPAEPFDHVARVRLTGHPGRRHEDEIIVSGDGPFVASTIGYGVAIDHTDVTVAPDDGPDPVDLTALPMTSLGTDVLLDGFRIRPEYLQVAFETTAGQPARLSTRMPRALANALFARLHTPENVSFRYALFDAGSGQALQSHPLHNVAGLGAADGRRPFRAFARPLRLDPRSKLRLEVIEGFGRGTLYVTLQGHRLNAASRGER